MSQLKSFYSVNQSIARHLPFWTQGAGSNVSCKIDQETLVIKASGHRLDQVTESEGFVYLDFRKLREKLKNLLTVEKSAQEIGYSQAVSECKVVDQITLRPSMESGFHALSSKKWVAHFHSLASILMAEFHSKNSFEFQAWLQKKNWNNQIAFIPLSKPGWELSAFFYSTKAPISIIVNHGVILQSDDPNILELWAEIERDFLMDFKFVYLNSLMENRINSQSSALDYCDHLLKVSTPFSLRQGPVKFYFPDMAIYFSKLESFLKKTNKNDYELALEAPQDLKEIWLATQVLFRSCPDLIELPEKMVEDIVQLPTEKLRQIFLK